jgi:hypothetical protein
LEGAIGVLLYGIFALEVESGGREVKRVNLRTEYIADTESGLLEFRYDSFDTL